MGAGLEGSFDAAARRELVALIAANPALLLLRGAPAGTSLAAVMFVSTGAYLGLAAGLMMTFTAVRHTRGDEDAGRAELVRSTVVGRAVPLLATLVAGLVELAVVVVAVLVAGLAVGMPAGGMLLVAGGVGLVGVGGLLIGVLAGQAMATSRGANGLAALVVGAWFLLRGTGDALGTASADLTRVESGWPVWLSPIGWATQTHPFAEEPWTPRAAPLALFVPTLLVLLAATLLAERRRELGGSLLAARRGPARASGRLGTSLGLAVRLQRGAALGWLLAAVVMGLTVGRLAPAVADAFAANDTLRQLLDTLSGGGVDLVQSFLLAIAGVVSALASAAAMQAATRMRAEELAHGEHVLATPTSRLAWFGSMLAVGLATAVGVLAVFSLTAGLSLQVSGDGRLLDALAVGVAMLPAPVAYLAAGALIVALVPGTASWLGWLLVFGLLLLGQFAPLFGPDWDWLHDLSPFTHLANPLADDPDWRATGWLLVASVAGLVVATAVLRRRDATV